MTYRAVSSYRIRRIGGSRYRILDLCIIPNGAFDQLIQSHPPPPKNTKWRPVWPPRYLIDINCKTIITTSIQRTLNGFNACCQTNRQALAPPTNVPNTHSSSPGRPCDLLSAVRSCFICLLLIEMGQAGDGELNYLRRLSRGRL